MDRYASLGAYRRALEDRLRIRAQDQGIALQRLRARVAMERLLARLFETGDPPWLLKGGYALELRFHPRARTTRDIDLGLVEEAKPDWTGLRDRIQQAASVDLHDGFDFLIGPVRKELQGAPGGGARYPVEARVAGRSFCRFHVDVGAGDPVTGEPEELVGPDFLDFAGVPPARVRAVPVAQVIAEKLHAYTRERAGRENTRVRDLVDLLLIAEAGFPSGREIRDAVNRTFAACGLQPVPDELPEPPTSWQDEFESMVRDLALPQPDLSAATAELNMLWNRVRTAP